MGPSVVEVGMTIWEFWFKNMSGVGISLLDRIYLVVEELNLFRKRSPNHQKLFIITATEAFYAQAIQVTKPGIKVELYPDNAKVAKQFQHADKRSIPLQ
jgi:histidyl-tRNA synthetase